MPYVSHSPISLHQISQITPYLPNMTSECGRHTNAYLYFDCIPPSSTCIQLFFQLLCCFPQFSLIICAHPLNLPPITTFFRQTDLNNALGSNVPPYVIISLPALSNPLYSTCKMNMFSLSGHFTISSIVPRKNCDHPIYIDVYILPQKMLFCTSTATSIPSSQKK